MRRHLLAFIFFAAGICAAQSTCEQLVPKAMELYGTNDALRSFPAQMQSQINGQMSQDKSITEAERAKLTDTITKSMDVNRLIKTVEQGMLVSCNPADLNKVIEDLNTPLLQKMRAFESATNTPEGAQKLQHTLTLDDVKSPPDERTTLIRRLMNTSGAADAMTDTVIATSRGMMEGVGAPPLKEEQIVDMRRQVEAMSYQQMNMLMTAIYHDASDADLSAYIKVMNSKAFQDFMMTMTKAMVKGMADEARFTGIALKKITDERQAQQAAADEAERPTLKKTTEPASKPAAHSAAKTSTTKPVPNQ